MISAILMVSATARVGAQAAGDADHPMQQCLAAAWPHCLLCVHRAQAKLICCLVSLARLPFKASALGAQPFLKSVLQAFPDTPEPAVRSAMQDGLQAAASDEGVSAHEMLCARDYSGTCPQGVAQLLPASA